MDFAQLLDWANLLLRWAHLIIGIGWIGSSFYFVWLDMSLRKEDGQEPGVLGESWMVHGGGFYRATKYAVAPEKLPKTLHWFKYEAYFTWVTGFLLLIVLYYFGADAFLINKSVMNLNQPQAIFVSLVMLFAGWAIYELLCRSDFGQKTNTLALSVFALIIGAAYLFTQVFSGRGAFIHTGVLVGTIMAGNVFWTIIPNQRKAVAEMLAGQAPNPRYGKEAKQRSLHNNYLTLPLLLMMISNHYPMIYDHKFNWVVVGFVVILGGVIRHFINNHDAGIKGGVTPWLIPAAGVVLLAFVWFVSYKPAPKLAEGETLAAVDPRAIMHIVNTHCIGCHSALPTDPDFTAPPGGVVFDAPSDVARFAAKINQQAGVGQIMPLGNKTGIADDERATLRAWFAAGGAM
jgi:uncharacterized membrane protein